MFWKFLFLSEDAKLFFCNCITIYKQVPLVNRKSGYFFVLSIVIELVCVLILDIHESRFPIRKK